MDERDFDRVVNGAAFFCRKVDEVTSAKFLDMIDAQRGERYDIKEHEYFFGGCNSVLGHLSAWHSHYQLKEICIRRGSRR